MSASRKAAAIALAIVLAAAGSAAAQDNLRDISLGRLAAETWCINCHVIGTENQPKALAGPPSFVSLAAGGISEVRLAYALIHPHPAMPKFELSRDIVNALAAYINSLKE